MTFKEFLNTQEIDSLYQKTKIAVQIVRMYNPNILQNIATIADLPNGAYGLYNSGENQKILPPNTEKSLVGWGKVDRHNLNMLPKKLIKQYYPQFPINAIKSSDTIRVNVRRILKEFPDDANRIIQIACTIIHEATHELERELTGQTSEANPYNEEKRFMNWVSQNSKKLAQQFPEFQHLPNMEIITKH